jgi:hypothetical protein
MAKADLEALKVTLGRLPKNQAVTAEVGWFDIALAATEYAQAIADPPKRNPAPWKVEQELKAIAVCARTLRHKLANVSRPALAAIENDAHSRIGKAADPWPWFPIGRYSFDDEGVPEQEEPWWGHDDMRGYELGALATFLDDVAGHTATRKSEPKGKRTPTQTQQVKSVAKHRLIEWLRFELHIANDRPISHVMPIAQAVHTWATGEVVGKDWGQTEMDRIKEQIAALPF